MKKNILKDLSSSIFYDKKYTLFSMIGDDVISFLDRMSTNDINQKKASKTVITNNKGSIVDIISYKVIDQSASECDTSEDWEASTAVTSSFFCFFALEG